MDKPQIGQPVTDPDEIMLVRLMRALSPEARADAVRLLRAMAEHAPAQEIRALVLRLARARGVDEAEALEVMRPLLGPRAVG